MSSCAVAGGSYGKCTAVLTIVHSNPRQSCHGDRAGGCDVSSQAVRTRPCSASCLNKPCSVCAFGEKRGDRARPPRASRRPLGWPGAGSALKSASMVKRNNGAFYGLMLRPVFSNVAGMYVHTCCAARRFVTIDLPPALARPDKPQSLAYYT